LTEINSDEQLGRLISTKGFLVNVDHPTRDVKLHKISCKFCDPKNPKGVKPSSKKLSKTGEFWYSDNLNEADSKAQVIAIKRRYKYSLCAICNP